MKYTIPLFTLFFIALCFWKPKASVVVVDTPETDTWIGPSRDTTQTDPAPTDTPPPSTQPRWPLSTPESPKFQPIALKESTKPNTVSIAFEDKWIHFITNETSTFTDLMDQVKRTAPPEQIIYVDRHFNAGGGSGFLMLSNERGVNFALKLNDEYEKIYSENGWNFYPEGAQIRKDPAFAVLRLATDRRIAAVIDEFGFIDDPLNGEAIRTFMRSKNGQLQIATATLTAIVNTDFKHLVLGAGHHGSRGTGGASFDGNYTEIKYAFETFEAMNELIQQGFIPKKSLEPTEIFEIKPDKAASGSKAKACKT